MNETYLANFHRTQPASSDQELAWLKHFRAAAWESFLLTGFPTRRDEAWKYTDLGFLRDWNFAYPDQSVKLSRAGIEKLENAYCMVFLNGHFSAELSQLDDLADHIMISSLRAAMIAQPELITLLLKKEVTTSAPFIAMNNAVFLDGLVLRLPKNYQLKKPLQLLHITTNTLAAPTLVASRNYILLQENSAAQIIEEHRALDEAPYWKNSVLHIDLAPGANLQYYKVQQENNQAVHYAVTEVSQQRDSIFSHYSFSAGSKLARDDLNIALQDAGAHCALFGLYLAQQSQHADHHSRIDHAKPHCSSEQFYKGILSDKSSAVFNGKVLVRPQAQKTQSQQTNKNLLLSKTAEINTKPELEIYADDVKCTHGATVGQIDETSLFYLQSRGIERNAAIGLLTQAFAEDILTKVVDEDISAYLHQRLLDSFTSLAGFPPAREGA